MDAIDTIISTINERSQADRTAFEVQRKQEIDAAIEKQLAELKTQQTKEKARKMANLDKFFGQTKQKKIEQWQTQKNLARELLLDEMFQAAYQRMIAWDSEKTRAFFAQNVAVLPLQKATVHLASQMSEEILDTKWLHELSAKKEITLTLGEKTHREEYGFLFVDHGIQYNCLYRDLLEEVKKTEGSTLLSLLFKNEGES